MFKSMTGYGKTVCELPGRNIIIEVRTLNSKNLDISFRIPSIFKERELKLRNLASQLLERGKVDISIYADGRIDGNSSLINTKAIIHYYDQLKALPQGLVGSDNNLLAAILRLPDSIEIKRDELDEDQWNLIESKFHEALDQVDVYREQEGKTLEIDILERIRVIDGSIREIEPFEQERIERVKKRILDQLDEWMQGNNADKNRFEQELFYYLERLDITEEKVRLHQHCEFFLETAAQHDANGKKLGFITQEIGREINTLGSKSNDHQMQRIVVAMKDELEKVKEQLLNVL